MDSDEFGRGLLIAALTMGSVGPVLVGFSLFPSLVSVPLLIGLFALSGGAFVVWRQFDRPWYFAVAWLTPLVAALTLLANLSRPGGRIRFFATLFAILGVVNLTLWIGFRSWSRR